MHSIFKEIHPPTVVDHAVRCYFFDSREINLVTAGGQRLNVYRLCDADMVVSITTLHNMLKFIQNKKYQCQHENTLTIISNSTLNLQATVFPINRTFE